MFLKIHQEDWGGKNLPERIQQQQRDFESMIYPLWKSYSMRNLDQLRKLYASLKSGKEDELKMNNYLMTSIFDGQTIFSLFADDKDKGKLEQI